MLEEILVSITSVPPLQSSVTKIPFIPISIIDY
ncbi:hypothetical protein DERF_001217 [Dermatophagoides farinae]|uniref:Uncharacterized protein n=1 Tax=Dermatophagoides farinae TaxID=6954 RepID=A0A922IBE8_DERFA|nr:hypothetical protein DERF_001217 [Dermatophagoides farinae]